MQSERERLRAERRALRRRMYAQYAASDVFGPGHPQVVAILRRLLYDADLQGAMRAFLDLCAAHARETGEVERIAAELDRAEVFETRLDMMRWIASAMEEPSGGGSPSGV